MNTLGRVSSNKSLRKNSSSSVRGRAAFPFEEVPDLHVNNEDKPVIIENTLELSLLSKGADFAEDLAERVFDRKLHEHFGSLLSQTFGEEEDASAKNGQRAVLYKSHYGDLPPRSIDRKIQTLAFAYLAPFQGGFALKEGIEAGMLIAGNAYNAVKVSCTEASAELAGMGLLNGVVSESLLSAQVLMDAGIVDSTINLVEKELGGPEQLSSDSLNLAVPAQTLKQNLEFSELVSSGLLNRQRPESLDLLASAQSDSLASELSLCIETHDGDLINISFLESVNSGLLAPGPGRTSEPHSAHYFNIQKSRNSNLMIGVDASLNAAEIAALNQFLTQVLSLSEQFFIHDIRQAYGDASRKGFTMEEIAVFSLDLYRRAQFENIKTYESVALAVDEQALNPSQAQTFLGPLQNYVHALHGMLLRGEQFGVKKSDHFIEKSLAAIISLDKRQKYAFLKTDIADELLIEELIKSVRAAM